MPPNFGMNGQKKAITTTTSVLDDHPIPSIGKDKLLQQNDTPSPDTPPKAKKPLGPPTPPDGGWGWVVVFSSFMISVLVDGVCFTTGIFFNPLKSYYGASVSQTAWVGSVLNGSYLSVGPLVSACVNRYGCRRVAMFGSVFASISFFISTFSPNMPLLIVTFGLLGGIGFGFVYLPAIVMVGYYFEKRRALATGIACCGSGIGAFLFAPIVNMLLEVYDWKGALWIMSGLVLNGLVFSIFYRPLENGPAGPSRDSSVERGGESGDDEVEALLMKDGENNSILKPKGSGPLELDMEAVKAMLKRESEKQAQDWERKPKSKKQVPEVRVFRPSTPPPPGVRPPSPIPVERPSTPIPMESPMSSPASQIASKSPLGPELIVNNLDQAQLEPSSPFQSKVVLIGSPSVSSDVDGDWRTPTVSYPAAVVVPCSEASGPVFSTYDPPVVITDIEVEVLEDKSVKSTSTKSLEEQEEERALSLEALSDKNGAIPSMIIDLIQTVTPEISPPVTSEAKSFLSDIHLTEPTMPVARMAFSQGLLAGPNAVRRRQPGHHHGPHSRHHRSSHHLEVNPLQRRDIFYSGSLRNLPEYASSNSLAEYRQKVAWMDVEELDGGEESEEEEERGLCRRWVLDPLLMVFDVSLLKSPTFVIYGLSCFLCMLGFFVPFIYLPTLCIDLGIDATKAAFLISIIGIANTIGRVAVGFVSDQPWADCLLINNVALVIGGVITCCVPFLHIYPLFAAYTFLFGTCIAIFVSLRSIIMVELMGLQKLTNAFGLVIMCQGISSFIGAPIAGLLSDATGDYSISFYIAGIFMGAAGVICFPLRRIAIWEAKREMRKKGKELFGDVANISLKVEKLSSTSI